MATSVTPDDFARLERKVNIIMDAMGLSENHRLSPVEVDEISKGILLKFRKKQEAKRHDDQRS